MPETRWPAECLKSERRFGLLGRFFPLIGKRVQAQCGIGILIQVLPKKAAVLLERDPGKVRFMSPFEIWPAPIQAAEEIDRHERQLVEPTLSELCGAPHNSLIESAKLNGIDPYHYIKDVLTRVWTHPQSRIKELMPRLWKPTGPPNAADRPPPSAVDSS